MKRSKPNTFLRRIAPLYDVYIGRDHIAFDSTGWGSLAFDLAAAADHYHGHLVPDYRPGAFGSASALSESLRNNGMGSILRPMFRRATPETLEAACNLAFRYYKAANGESY